MTHQHTTIRQSDDTAISVDASAQHAAEPTSTPVQPVTPAVPSCPGDCQGNPDGKSGAAGASETGADPAPVTRQNPTSGPHPQTRSLRVRVVYPGQQIVYGVDDLIVAAKYGPGSETGWVLLGTTSVYVGMVED